MDDVYAVPNKGSHRRVTGDDDVTVVDNAIYSDDDNSDDVSIVENDFYSKERDGDDVSLTDNDFNT